MNDMDKFFIQAAFKSLDEIDSEENKPIKKALLESRKREKLKRCAGNPELNARAFNHATDVGASSPSTGLGEDYNSGGAAIEKESEESIEGYKRRLERACESRDTLEEKLPTRLARAYDRTRASNIIKDKKGTTTDEKERNLSRQHGNTPYDYENSDYTHMTYEEVKKYLRGHPERRRNLRVIYDAWPNTHGRGYSSIRGTLRNGNRNAEIVLMFSETGRLLVDNDTRIAYPGETHYDWGAEENKSDYEKSFHPERAGSIKFDDLLKNAKAIYVTDEDENLNIAYSRRAAATDTSGDCDKRKNYAENTAKVVEYLQDKLGIDGPSVSDIANVLRTPGTNKWGHDVSFRDYLYQDIDSRRPVAERKAALIWRSVPTDSSLLPDIVSDDGRQRYLRSPKWAYGDHDTHRNRRSINLAIDSLQKELAEARRDLAKAMREGDAEGIEDAESDIEALQKEINDRVAADPFGGATAAEKNSRAGYSSTTDKDPVDILDIARDCAARGKDKETGTTRGVSLSDTLLLFYFYKFFADYCTSVGIAVEDDEKKAALVRNNRQTISYLQDRLNKLRAEMSDVQARIDAYQKQIDDIELENKTSVAQAALTEKLRPVGKALNSATRSLASLVAKANGRRVDEAYDSRHNRYDLKDPDDVEKAKRVREESDDESDLVIIHPAYSHKKPRPGNAIISCKACEEVFYIDKSELEQGEDDPDLYNADMRCENCGAEDGYDYIGDVAEADTPSAEEAISERESEADEFTEPEEEPEEAIEEEPEEETEGEEESEEDYYEKFDDEEEPEELVEESFDKLVSKYATNVFENFASYRTTSVSEKAPGQYLVEGVITSSKGEKRHTSFELEETSSSMGRRIFEGRNRELANSAKPYRLAARVENKKLIFESLRYSYPQKVGRKRYLIEGVQING